MDVSDRRMQVQLTPEAKIATDFFLIGAIFAVVGFVSALSAVPDTGAALFHAKKGWAAVLRITAAHQKGEDHEETSNVIIITEECLFSTEKPLIYDGKCKDNTSAHVPRPRGIGCFGRIAQISQRRQRYG